MRLNSANFGHWLLIYVRSKILSEFCLKFDIEVVLTEIQTHMAAVCSNVTQSRPLCSLCTIFIWRLHFKDEWKLKQMARHWELCYRLSLSISYYLIAAFEATSVFLLLEILLLCSVQLAGYLVYIELSTVKSRLETRPL